MKGRGRRAPSPVLRHLFVLEDEPVPFTPLWRRAALNAAYGDTVAASRPGADAGRSAMVPDLDKGCSNYLSDKFGTVDISKVTKADPFTIRRGRKKPAGGQRPGTFHRPRARSRLSSSRAAMTSRSRWRRHCCSRTTSACRYTRSRTLGLPRAEATLGPRDRAIGARHDALDHRPLAAPRSGSVHDRPVSANIDRKTCA